MTHAIQNDTYGEITYGELAALRSNAHPCTTCGMLVAALAPHVKDTRSCQ